MAVPATTDLILHYYKSTGERVENHYTGQTSAAAAALIATAAAAGTIIRIVFQSF